MSISITTYNESGDLMSFEDFHKSWIRYLPVNKGKALDIVAGSGRDAKWLADKGFDVVALEPAKALLELCKKHTDERYGVKWLCDSYDLVLISSVWVNLNNEKRVTAFKNLASLLKLGGTLIITYRNDEFSDNRDIYNVGASEFEKLLPGIHLVDHIEEDLQNRSNISWTTLVFIKKFPFEDTLTKWQQDLQGEKHNTYKLALQLAILDHVTKPGSLSHLSTDCIYKFFIERYWDNSKAYRLREGRINQEPLFAQTVKEVLPEFNGILFKDLKGKNLQIVLATINNQGFKNKLISKLRNPIARLQKDSNNNSKGNGSENGLGWLYRWDKSKITINQAHALNLSLGIELFNKITIFEWAQLIERKNSVPLILTKLLPAKARIQIPVTTKHFFRDNNLNNECFYCKCKLENKKYEIDHFIPYTFVIHNEIWNLVSTCS